MPMTINTTRRTKAQGAFATPQTPVDGDSSPVPDLPAEKLLEGKPDVVLNVFSKANYKHGNSSTPSYAQVAATPVSDDEEGNSPFTRNRKKSLFGNVSSVSSSSPLVGKQGKKQDINIERLKKASEAEFSSIHRKKPKLERLNSFGLRNGFQDKVRLKSPTPMQETKRLPKQYSP